MKKILLSTVLLSVLFFIGCSATINPAPPDNSAPFVKATVPGDNADNVPTNQRITIFFNEKVDTETAEAAIELRAGSSSVNSFTFEWTTNKDTVILVMLGAGKLTENTNYSLTIKAGFKDFRENQATDPYTAQFSTGTTTAPSNFSVERIIPLSNSMNIQTSAPLIFKIFFTDEVNPAAVTSANFRLAETASHVFANCDIILSLNMLEVTLITKDDLQANFQYTLTVVSTVLNNRAPATTLGTDFKAYYTTENFNFNTKNSAMFLLFNGKDSSISTNFKCNAMGKFVQGKTTSKNYSQKTK